MSRKKTFSSVLVEKYNLTQRDADQFVTEMFAVIRENLLKDKVVKVKGLGTFKLTEISARKSVNVNTGESIVLDGRSKVTFTPENAVRDRINAPFAQFESFDIEDSTDFNTIDAKYANDSETPTTEELPATQEITETPETPETLEPQKPSEPQGTPEPQIPSEPQNTPEPQEPVELPETQEIAETQELPETQESLKPSEPQESLEPSETQEPPETLEPLEPSETQSQPESQEPSEPLKPSEPQSPVPVYEAMPVAEAQPDVEDDSIDLAEELQRSNNIVKVLSVALVITLLALVAAVGFYFWNERQKAAVQDVPQDTVAVAETSDTTVVVEDTVATTVEETAAAEPEEAGDPYFEYNNRREIRHSSHRIVGIEEITIDRDYTLEELSLEKLGKHRKEYVRVVNDGRSRFKAGDIVRIPIVD